HHCSRGLSPRAPALPERHPGEQAQHGGGRRQVPPAGGAGVVEGPGDDGVVRDDGRRTHPSSSWSSVRSRGCCAEGGGPSGAEGSAGEVSGPPVVAGPVVAAVASASATSDVWAAVAAARARRAPRTRALPPG